MLQNRPSPSYSITGLHPYPWIRWWYVLAAPSAPIRMEELPLHEREFLRRGKLIAIALLIELIELLVQSIPASHDGTNALPAILISIGFVIVAILLNRTRKLLLAGLLVIGVLEAGMISVLALPPGSQLGLAQIPLMFILIQPLIVSVLLFPAWGILVMAAINMTVTCLMLLFLPKTPEFQAYLQAHAGPMFGVPLSIQLLCALICFIMITSLQESLTRADKAEEVTKLQQVMAEQARQELQTKRQLEVGMQEIMSGLTRLANGDNHARIQLEQGHLLWSVASSINNMIGRFVRLREQERPMEQTVMALRAYVNAIQTARATGAPLPAARTGTEVDILVGELLQYTSNAQEPLSNKQSTW